MKRLKLTPEFLQQFENIPHGIRSPHVYILREREFIRLNENTYKIGETTKPLTRFNGYPKETELLYFRQVQDSLFVESVVKKRFKEKFEHKQLYGREYFAGNLTEMISEMDKIVIQCSLHEKFKSVATFLICKPLPKVPVFKNNLSKVIKKKFSFDKPLPQLPPRSLKIITRDLKNKLDALEKQRHSLQFKNTETKQMIGVKEQLQKHTCLKCMKTYSTEKTLKKHLMKPISCDNSCAICGIKHISRNDYNTHQKTVHADLVKPRKKYVRQNFSLKFQNKEKDIEKLVEKIVNQRIRNLGLKK